MKTMKTIKFDLKLKNGEITLRTLDDLEENLSPELFTHFHSGKLAKWLRVRKLDELAEKMEALRAQHLEDKNELDVKLFKNLCEIFVNEVSEEDAREAMQDYQPATIEQNSNDEEIESLKAENETLKTEIELLKNPPKPKITEERIGRFIVRDDGTALDTKTGLTWCRYAVGQHWENGEVKGNAENMVWTDSVKAAEKFKLTTENFNWRLPKFNELWSILETNHSPVINLKVFPKTPIEKFDYFFWSSDSEGILNAHVMCFKEGHSGSIPKNNLAYLRLVHD